MSRTMTDEMPEPEEDCSTCEESTGHDEDCGVLDVAESFAEMGFA